MTRFLKSREAILLGALLALVFLAETRFSGFAAPGNLVRIFNDTSILIILALGQTMVILTRCIDLSQASNLALTGMVTAMMNAAMPGLPVPLLILVAVGIGLVLGALNGLLVWKLDIPPIVVTLGTLTIFRGLVFLVSGGAWVNSHEMSAAYKGFPRADILGLPVMSWIALATIAAFAVAVNRTSLGRAFYAVGGNPGAAVYTGIDVGRTRFWAFVIAGGLAGLCGYLWVARYAVAYTDVAGGFELDIIAACVIGGIAISGGLGTVTGAVLGALFLGTIKNALPVAGISPFWQMAISGTAIIVAVAVNRRRTPGRIILKEAKA
ncbi:rhamnose transport system permease protein [Palleronia aestuarii]|uniref:Rhamnose transport system permease protein n=1 Tax=Palleronia aestuarii TaxID=568105 RepID=A0A2W7N257_9RHOB|nr:ABC transporter permease [Palleronia aestuarii]PZX13783.1 rhamnose transport system permease protein [Palleronia aestuarii]